MLIDSQNSFGFTLSFYADVLCLIMDRFRFSELGKKTKKSMQSPLKLRRKSHPLLHLGSVNEALILIMEKTQGMTSQWRHKIMQKLFVSFCKMFSNITQERLSWLIISTVIDVMEKALQINPIIKFDTDIEHAFISMWNAFCELFECRVVPKLLQEQLLSLSPLITAALQSPHIGIKQRTRLMWSKYLASTSLAIPDHLFVTLKAEGLPPASISETVVQSQSLSPKKIIPTHISGSFLNREKNKKYSSVSPKLELKLQLSPLLPIQSSLPTIMSRNKILEKGKLNINELNTEDFVIISPPVVKNMISTPHQNEKRKKKTSDIPALYNDLSQSVSLMPSQFLNEDLIGSSCSEISTSNKPNTDLTFKDKISKGKFLSFSGNQPDLLIEEAPYSDIKNRSYSDEELNDVLRDASLEMEKSFSDSVVLLENNESDVRKSRRIKNSLSNSNNGFSLTIGNHSSKKKKFKDNEATCNKRKSLTPCKKSVNDIKRELKGNVNNSRTSELRQFKYFLAKDKSPKLDISKEKELLISNTSSEAKSKYKDLSPLASPLKSLQNLSIRSSAKSKFEKNSFLNKNFNKSSSKIYASGNEFHIKNKNASLKSDDKLNTTQTDMLFTRGSPKALCIVKENGINSLSNDRPRRNKRKSIFEDDSIYVTPPKRTKIEQFPQLEESLKKLENSVLILEDKHEGINSKLYSTDIKIANLRRKSPLKFNKTPETILGTPDKCEATALITSFVTPSKVTRSGRRVVAPKKDMPEPMTPPGSLKLKKNFSWLEQEDSKHALLNSPVQGNSLESKMENEMVNTHNSPTNDSNIIETVIKNLKLSELSEISVSVEKTQERNIQNLKLNDTVGSETIMDNKEKTYLKKQKESNTIRKRQSKKIRFKKRKVIATRNLAIKINEENVSYSNAIDECLNSDQIPSVNKLSGKKIVVDFVTSKTSENITECEDKANKVMETEQLERKIENVTEIENLKHLNKSLTAASQCKETKFNESQNTEDSTEILMNNSHGKDINNCCLTLIPKNSPSETMKMQEICINQHENFTDKKIQGQTVKTALKDLSNSCLLIKNTELSINKGSDSNSSKKIENNNLISSSPKFNVSFSPGSVKSIPNDNNGSDLNTFSNKFHIVNEKLTVMTENCSQKYVEPNFRKKECLSKCSPSKINLGVSVTSMVADDETEKQTSLISSLQHNLPKGTITKFLFKDFKLLSSSLSKGINNEAAVPKLSSVSGLKDDKYLSSTKVLVNSDANMFRFSATNCNTEDVRSSVENCKMHDTVKSPVKSVTSPKSTCLLESSNSTTWLVSSTTKGQKVLIISSPKSVSPVKKIVYSQQSTDKIFPCNDKVNNSDQDTLNKSNAEKKHSKNFNDNQSNSTTNSPTIIARELKEFQSNEMNDQNSLTATQNIPSINFPKDKEESKIKFADLPSVTHDKFKSNLGKIVNESITEEGKDLLGEKSPLMQIKFIDKKESLLNKTKYLKKSLSIIKRKSKLSKDIFRESSVQMGDQNFCDATANKISKDIEEHKNKVSVNGGSDRDEDDIEVSKLSCSVGTPERKNISLMKVQLPGSRAAIMLACAKRTLKTRDEYFDVLSDDHTKISRFSSGKCIDNNHQHSPRMTPKRKRKLNEIYDEKPWAKHEPSPGASPIGSILKKRQVDDECISAVVGELEELENSPSIKHRRVSFADPPVSESVEIPPSPKVFKCHKAQKRLDMTQVLNSVEVLATDSENCEEIEISLNTANSSQPVFPSLLNCLDSIEVISSSLTSLSLIESLKTVFRDRGIKTIGDFCAMSEVEIQSLPVRSPKISNTRKCLQNYEQMRYISEKDATSRCTMSEIANERCSVNNQTETSLASVPLDSDVSEKEAHIEYGPDVNMKITNYNVENKFQNFEESTKEELENRGYNNECLIKDFNIPNVFCEQLEKDADIIPSFVEGLSMQTRIKLLEALTNIVPYKNVIDLYHQYLIRQNIP